MSGRVGASGEETIDFSTIETRCGCTIDFSTTETTFDCAIELDNIDSIFDGKGKEIIPEA